MTSKYLTAAYAATDFSFPYCQALRGEDPKQCGYFVPLPQADKAGWRDIDPNNLTEYSYNSGKTEVGILLKQPRMALTPICQLGMFDRKASQDEESLVVIIDGYVAPTADNWQDFFLGTDEDIADLVIGIMNPQPRLLLADPTPGTIVMTPPADPQPQNLQITPAVDDAVAAIDVSSSMIDAVDEEFDNIPF